MKKLIEAIKEKLKYRRESDMMNYTISSPWYTFGRKVKALFGGDPDYRIGEVRECGDAGADYELDFEVRNHEKFPALERILPKTKTFGNVKLRINLFDEENGAEDRIDLIRKIFEGNPAVSHIAASCDAADVLHGYVLFKPEVMQFFNDDLSDFNGNWSGLAQDIAREIFDDLPGIHFCTAELPTFTGEEGE